MRKTTKICLILAACLVLVGSILFVGIMRSLRWDFTKLSTVNYETNTYEIRDAFQSISLNTNTADIHFVLSEDEICTVSCQEEAHAKHSVSVKDNTLTIQMVDDRSMTDYIHHISINFGSPKITIHLPKAEYTLLAIQTNTGDVEIAEKITFTNVDITSSTGAVVSCASASELLKIKTNTGDIRVENVSVGGLDLSVSTGRITVNAVTCTEDATVHVSTGAAYLTDLHCKNLTSTGSTGDISLNRVIAAEKYFIQRSTGDIRFQDSDAAEIYAKTNTGDIIGSFLTGKVFVTQSSTGSIQVPQATDGGKCELITATGDILITTQ